MTRSAIASALQCVLRGHRPPRRLLHVSVLRFHIILCGFKRCSWCATA